MTTSQITGVVTQGLKEAAYFLSLPGYRRGFKEALGLDPFPGTLNIKIEPQVREMFLNNLPAGRVEGFWQDDHRLAGLDYHLANLNGCPVAIIVPDKTRHGEEILEAVSPLNLREKLHLSDGDEVTISAA